MAAELSIEQAVIIAYRAGLRDMCACYVMSDAYVLVVPKPDPDIPSVVLKATGEPITETEYRARSAKSVAAPRRLRTVVFRGALDRSR